MAYAPAGEMVIDFVEMTESLGQQFDFRSFVEGYRAYGEWVEAAQSTPSPESLLALKSLFETARLRIAS